MTPSDFPLADGPERQLDWTKLKQNEASDPRASAWVSANAGSGKTHVLTQRVIRLMLAGARPSAILCLTYTKAAASEMSNRVFDRLARWATMDDAALSDEIAQLEGRRPDAILLAEARRLFARALETPGGLKIQTIHAFCEALLHQFPLEANVAGHFSVLDDTGSAELLVEARRRLLGASHLGHDPALSDALAHVLEIADETGLDRLLEEIVSRRNQIRAFLGHAESHGGVKACLASALSLDLETDRQALLDNLWPLPGLAGQQLVDFIALADTVGGAKPQEAARQLAAAAEATGQERLDILRSAFLTGAGKPRAMGGFFNKAMEKADPELPDRINAIVAGFLDTLDLISRHDLMAATMSALTLARKLDDDYQAMKLRRGLLDFEDLIERTAQLFAKRDIASWIHYKLDQGIDHILVDEAQDTSPTQWTIIKALAADFFSGESGRATLRTFFAVGDEKQSIYSFQGARPEKFDEEQRATARQVNDAGLTFRAIRLPLSFRSTNDVLSAVDQVFSVPDNARGLSAAGEPPVHKSNRFRDVGRVDIWDTIVPDPKAQDDEDWTAPYDRLSEQSPPAQLAQRICTSLQSMIGKTLIDGRDGARLVEAGDILVLVRKRDSFVGALTRALKRTGSIPVAGADRLMLASHIAVQDFIALGRFLLEPGDDLSLAALFKSPLLALTEDDLYRLAAEREKGQSLWAYLHRMAETDAALAAIRDRLEGWRTMARTLRPHDLFSRILGMEGGRRAYLSRLGQEVSDILDEFLAFALTHETSALPGLQSFIQSMEGKATTIKREQDKGRNEVRIMTVHAAKGLEAPIVFLVDGGSAVQVSQSIPKLRIIETARGTIPIWLLSKDMGCRLTEADNLRIKELAQAEYRRLLYVGMTRAADHLIICGYRGHTEIQGTWAQMARSALSIDGKRCQPATFGDAGLSWGGLTWRDSQERTTNVAPAAPEKTSTARTVMASGLMDPLPPENRLPRPLSPSGTRSFIDENDGDLVVGSALFAPGPAPAGLSALRGSIIHRMLELLPDHPSDQWEGLARRYADRAVPDWAAADRDDLVDNVLRVLRDPEITTLFALHGQSEVSIMGTIRLAGREHAVSGRIDRLVVGPEIVHILDYKTNRLPPAEERAVPDAHVAQMALYRQVLAPLYPGHEIRAALVYTAGPLVHVLSSRRLDAALVAISAK